MGGKQVMFRLACKIFSRPSEVRSDVTDNYFAFYANVCFIDYSTMYLQCLFSLTFLTVAKNIEDTLLLSFNEILTINSFLFHYDLILINKLIAIFMQQKAR